YLKGIGRTPLAANWSDPSDLYHNSGHQLPSAAAREYLVTCYLEARGLASAIHPCEGLLVRPVRPRIDRYVRATFRGHRRAQAPIAACDHTLQAISVKPGNFARASNFTWLLGHVRPDADWLADFFARLDRYLEGDADTNSELAAISPRSVAEKLACAI